MKMLIGLLLILACMPLSASFDTKCSVLITLRLQSSEDAYKEALQKIDQCEINDIISVTSFLEESISKVYITDIIQSYCCLLYTSPSPRDVEESRMPSSA